MIHTVIVAGITAALVVVFILGALAVVIERMLNASRKPREPLAKDSRDPFAEAVTESLRRRP